MIPLYVEGLLEGKEPFYLGRGENLRAVVHIDDVVDLFAMLLQEALDGDGIAQWGRQVSRTLHSESPSCGFTDLIKLTFVHLVSKPGILFRRLGRSGLERRRRSHHPTRPGAEMAPGRHSHRLVQRRTAQSRFPAVARFGFLSVWEQQPCELGSSSIAFGLVSPGPWFLEGPAGRCGGFGCTIQEEAGCLMGNSNEGGAGGFVLAISAGYHKSCQVIREK